MTPTEKILREGLKKIVDDIENGYSPDPLSLARETLTKADAMQAYEGQSITEDDITFLLQRGIMVANGTETEAESRVHTRRQLEDIARRLTHSADVAVDGWAPNWASLEDEVVGWIPVACYRDKMGVICQWNSIGPMIHRPLPDTPKEIP